MYKRALAKGSIFYLKSDEVLQEWNVNLLYTRSRNNPRICQEDSIGGSDNVKIICASHSAFASVHRNGTVTTWGNLDWGGNSTSFQPLYDVKAIFSTNRFANHFDGTLTTWGQSSGRGDSNSVQS